VRAAVRFRCRRRSSCRPSTHTTGISLVCKCLCAKADSGQSRRRQQRLAQQDHACRSARSSGSSPPDCLDLATTPTNNSSSRCGVPRFGGAGNDHNAKLRRRARNAPYLDRRGLVGPSLGCVGVVVTCRSPVWPHSDPARNVRHGHPGLPSPARRLPGKRPTKVGGPTVVCSEQLFDACGGRACAGLA